VNIDQAASNSDKFGESRVENAGATKSAPATGVSASPARSLPQTPSLFYGAAIWRLGLLLARILPTRLLKWHAAGLATIYACVFPRRREVVVRNLLPLCGGNRAQAEATTSELFRQFSRKLIDLWRFESGVPVDHLFHDLTGWSHFLDAQKNGRGVLLVTPHLGNWEFGAPLLTKHGYKLNVITLVEPGLGLTELRQAARARQGIETLVIGRDPFAFVEIIRRLEAGATVALLIDRPPKTSAVEVELFGQPFSASIAAAELARATNCQILPVALLQNKDGGYGGHVFPPVPYERATLRDRGARQELTQRIIRALEPTIRQHADQWYHFVPVWK
jgi:lauroyl/myristoyl acyltransferase